MSEDKKELINNVKNWITLDTEIKTITKNNERKT